MMPHVAVLLEVPEVGVHARKNSRCARGIPAEGQAPDVSQRLRSPVLYPVLNHCWRCAAEPCVHCSGTTDGWLQMRSSQTAAGRRAPARSRIVGARGSRCPRRASPKHRRDNRPEARCGWTAHSIRSAREGRVGSARGGRTRARRRIPGRRGHPSHRTACSIPGRSWCRGRPSRRPGNRRAHRGLRKPAGALRRPREQHGLGRQ